jgi:hypothetical protein
MQAALRPGTAAPGIKNNCLGWAVFGVLAWSICNSHNDVVFQGKVARLPLTTKNDINMAEGDRIHGSVVCRHMADTIPHGITFHDVLTLSCV